jgi:hypothetical protein
METRLCGQFIEEAATSYQSENVTSDLLHNYPAVSKTEADEC